MFPLPLLNAAMHNMYTEIPGSQALLLKQNCAEAQLDTILHTHKSIFIMLRVDDLLPIFLFYISRNRLVN